MNSLFRFFNFVLLSTIIFTSCSDKTLSDLENKALDFEKNTNVIILDSISFKAKELGILSYRVLNKSNSSELLKDFDVEIVLESGTPKRVNIEYFKSGLLRVRPLDRLIGNIELLELDYAEMSLKMNKNNENHLFYLRNRYSSDSEYNEAIKLFNSNLEAIGVLLTTSSDILGFYKVNISQPEIQKINGMKRYLNIEIKDIISARPDYCPYGSEPVYHTIIDPSRAAGSYLANVALQGDCTNGYCIGCLVNWGVDCLCIGGSDYGCICTAKGCGCSMPQVF